MRKLRGLIGRLSENFACGMSFIEIHGTSDMILSGCKRIIDYNLEEITCDTVSGVVRIVGERLTLDIFRGDILTVCGSITGVYLNKNYAD